MTTTYGTLKEYEFHPAAQSAFEWIQSTLSDNPFRASLLQESFASTAISGNRTAELCSETLRRILHGEPVGVVYILGLAWTMRQMDSLRREK
jgi:hypothetical protein